MANLFARLIGARDDPAARMDQNDWAAEMFTYAGNSYPIGQSGYSPSDNKEGAPNDFESYVEQAYKKSGIVFGVCLARAKVFTEARIQYQKMGGGRPGDLFGKPSLSIFEKPWPNGQTPDLLSHMLNHVDFAGNAYVVKEGASSLGNERLRMLRPDYTDIVLTCPENLGLKSDVAGYLHRPGGTMDDSLWKYYPIDGSQGVVAHWAPIPDPTAQYRGMSWMTPVLPEIMGDKSMMRHKNKFFDNAATPAITVSLNEQVTDAQFKRFMRRINQAHNGVDNAYKTLFLGGGADVKVIGTTLQQMDFTATAGHGETRIAMAGGVPPPLLPIAENMHGATLNQGNFTASKNLFVDGTMRWLWRTCANSLSVLVPELSNARLWYDDRDIPFLRQDRKDLADLKSLASATINSYITAGFTPESAVKAYNEDDVTLLVHTGLYSVQLTVPGAPGAAAGDAGTPGKPNQGANQPGSGAQDEDDDPNDEADVTDDGNGAT